MKKRLILTIIVFIIVAVILIGILLVKNILYNEWSNLVDEGPIAIQDEYLQKTYNELFGNSVQSLIVLNQSAKTLQDANKLWDEYVKEFNDGASKEFRSEEAFSGLKYAQSYETKQYYKYIGTYTYKYRRTSTLSETICESPTLLIFKTDYFNYPYFKECTNKQSVKEFGDLLAVLNTNRDTIIKTSIKENKNTFTYTVYYVGRSSYGPSADRNGIAPDVIKGVNYYMDKATLTVDKITGKTNLTLNKGGYVENMKYKNSYYPRLDTKTIKTYNKEFF